MNNMKEPLVSNCCCCWDLKIGNTVYAVLQIMSYIYVIFTTISELANPVTQDQIDELIKENEKQGFEEPIFLIELAKDTLNIPDCKLNIVC